VSKKKQAKQAKKPIPFPGTEAVGDDKAQTATEVDVAVEEPKTAQKPAKGRTKSASNKAGTSPKPANSAENGKSTSAKKKSTDTEKSIDIDEPADSTDTEEAEGEQKLQEITLEQHQRLLAEFDNFRKRTERERQRTSLWARAEILKAVIPVLDDFDRAKNALKPKDNAFDKEGMLIIMDRLAETLSKEGLVEVPAAPGDVFDPEMHEAVLMVPSTDIPEGCVSEVLEKGFRVDDRLLRPAKVVVARSMDTQPKDGDK